MLKAARRGHAEIAQWLLDNRQASSDKKPGEAIHVAIPLGQLGVLAWSAMGPHPSSHWFCVQTASGSRFIEGADISRLLRSRSPYEDVHVLEFAVLNGDINLLQRIYADETLRRGAILADTASLAARLGHLDMLQWLHDECGVEFSAQTIYLAARSGCLGALRWIHTCVSSDSFDSDMLLRAGVASTRREVVEWICTSYPSAQSKSHSQLETIGGAVDESSLLTQGELDVVEWLHDDGRVVSRDRLIEFATRCGKFSLLQDLVEPDSHSAEFWCWTICGISDTDIEMVRFMTEELQAQFWDGFGQALATGEVSTSCRSFPMPSGLKRCGACFDQERPRSNGRMALLGEYGVSAFLSE